MTSTQQSDIRKMGNLRKLKTMKRKLFLLREESASGPARLEYYDSEKKYKSGLLPKRAITLKTCFNINKKSDSKHKHAIALYTKDDCFSVVCDSEAEQNEWLMAMLELQNDTDDDSGTPRPTFEHIWQVTVMPRGLCNGRTLNSGSYRLCLTEKNLSLIRLNCEKPDLTFQLACIRRCGHTDNFFLMEVGRSAVTGAGELWMQVEDTVIAKNMHEAILSSMKSMNTAADLPSTTHSRPRSRSSASDHQRSKPITVPNSRGPSPGYEASTLPKRSKTISGEHPAHPSSPSRLRPGKSGAPGARPSTMAGISSLGRGHSPVANSPLRYQKHEMVDFSYTLESHRSRTDSMESRGSRGTSSSLSADEYDLSPMEHLSSGAASTRSVTPEGPVRESEYLSMIGTGKDMLASPSAPSGDAPPEKEGYMQMSPSGGPGSLPVTPVSNDDGGYMDMSPGTPVAEAQHYMDMSQTSFSSSPAVSTTSSHDPEDHAYLDMGHVGHLLPTVQERLPESSSGTPPADGGYLDMVPGHGTLPAKPSSTSQLKPDKVYSYLADTPGTEDFPKRAYSVGSKPTSAKTNYKAVPGYIDMSEKSTTLDKSNSKSCSAPHLVDKDKEKSHIISQGSHGSSKKDVGDLFMELDFFSSKKGDNGSFRPRTSSGGRDFRNRASSFGQEIRQRTGSFGKESISRTQSIGRHDGHRPRVQTLGQESLRPRTSSFGTVDAMRPRSSSYGNSRYRVQNSRESSRTSSQESLRKALGQRSSQESVKSNMSLDYMDMNPRLSTSPSQALAATFKAAERARNKALAARQEDYMSMSPSIGETKDAYMNMTSPPASSLSYSSQDSEHSDSSRKEGHGDHSQSVEKKVCKSHRRSSGRPQPVVALRIPTPDSMKSSTESLSSSSQSSAATREDSGSETGVSNQKVMGDYIDISYCRKNSHGSISKEKVEPTSNSVVSKERNSHGIITKDKVDKKSQSVVHKDLRHQGEKSIPKVDKIPKSSSPKQDLAAQETDSYMMYNPSKGSLGGSAPGPVPVLQSVFSPVRDEGTHSPAELGASSNCPPGKKNASSPANPNSVLSPSSASADTSYINLDFSSVKESGNVGMNKKCHTNKPEQNTKELDPVKEKSPSPRRSGSPGNSSSPGGSAVSGRSAKPPSLPAKPASAGNMLRDLRAKQEKHKVQTHKPQAAVEKVTPICAPFEPANGTPTASSVRQLTQANSNAEKQASPKPRIPSPLGGVSVASSSTSGSSSSGGSLSPRIVSSGAAGGRSRSASGGIVETISMSQPMSSRGSSSSLNSMEAATGKGSRMASRGSTGSLTAMDSSGKGSPRILLSECGSPDMTIGEVVTVSGKDVSRQSSFSSIVSEKELNYASLDLGSSTDEMSQAIVDRGPKSPMTTKSRHSSADDNETPLNYAEIDFSKSDGLGPSPIREGRCSFELK